MRIQNLVAIALLTLPAGLTAQGIRPRTPVRATEPQPAPLPPAAPEVARALALKRSRWSADGYSLISSVQSPAASGGFNNYTSVGAGTHADYRYTDSFSATADMTASLLGAPVTTITAEIGTRYSPVSWGMPFRPFFDVRAAYMHLFETSALVSGVANAIAGASSQTTSGQAYSRGFGGITGLGVEYSLTRSFALTTEMLAMRNRMAAYRSTTTANVPSGTSYWGTSVRYTLGLRFNPVSAMHMAQSPTSR